MNAIRLESVRCLADTGFIELRPLTLLVGKNNSGKSSYLRFLPLLRQTVETNRTEPLHWFGDYVDFGSFNETISTFRSTQEIRLGFRLNLDPQHILRQLRHGDLPPPPRAELTESIDLIPCELTLTVVPDSDDPSLSRIGTIRIEAAGQSILVELSGRHRLDKIYVNGAEPLQSYRKLHALQGFLVPNIHSFPETELAGESDLHLPEIELDGESDLHFPPFLREPPLALSQLMSRLEQMSHGNAALRKMRDVAYRIPFGTDEQILSFLKRIDYLGETWTTSIEDMSLDSSDFANLRNLLIVNALGAILRVLDYQLWTFADSVHYIKPLRATAQRYYRKQSLAVDDVHPDGRNLAMFISSLSDSERKEFDAWTMSVLNSRVVSSVDGGHFSLRLERDDSRSYNLADVGFGVSQILPVLAQLWAMRRNIDQTFRDRRTWTCVIEQPELHLHPGLQARVMETMIKMIKTVEADDVNLSVVIETHSEAMVNQVGRAVADGQINKEQTSVVLFERMQGSEESEVRVAHFDAEGFLVDWPFGFFQAK